MRQIILVQAFMRSPIRKVDRVTQTRRPAFLSRPSGGQSSPGPPQKSRERGERCISCKILMMLANFDRRGVLTGRACALAVALLLAAGAFAQSPDEQLFAAIEEGKELLAEGLVARGRASVNARNAARETALYWAVLSGHIVTAQRLLERGADPNVRDLKGNTALHAAADGGHLEIARMLLARMTEPGAKNREGLSARDYARRRGYEYIEKLLQ